MVCFVLDRPGRANQRPALQQPVSQMKPMFSDGFVREIRIPSESLWLFNIAMENGPFTDGLPIKNGDIPWLC